MNDLMRKRQNEETEDEIVPFFSLLQQIKC